MPDEFDPYQEWLGIEPHEHPVDHYRLLGIQQFETNPEVVHQAADERMTEIRLHQTGPRGRYTQQLLNEISAARVCLATAATRQAYNSQLVKLPEPPPVPPDAL